MCRLWFATSPPPFFFTLHCHPPHTSLARSLARPSNRNNTDNLRRVLSGVAQRADLPQEWSSEAVAQWAEAKGLGKALLLRSRLACGWWGFAMQL